MQTPFENKFEPRIRNLIKEHFDNEKPRVNSPGYVSKLYSSEAGGCQRKAMLRIIGARPERTFPTVAKEAMSFGNSLEDNTFNILKNALGDLIINQVELKTAYWSSRTDFVIGHGTDDVTIIEHKAMNAKWFDYKESFPKPEHVAQLALYKLLYFEVYKVVPKLILYYRAWGAWAEFDVTVDESGDVFVVGIVCEGEGKEKYRERKVLNIIKIKAALEMFYKLKVIPPRPDDADQDKLGCTFKGEVSCPFHSNCWPKMRTKDEVIEQIKIQEELERLAKEAEAEEKALNNMLGDYNE